MIRAGARRPDAGSGIAFPANWAMISRDGPKPWKLHWLPNDEPLTVIIPTRGWVGLRLRELWEYRDCSSSWPGATSRSATSRRVLGAAWAIIQPLLTMVVFSLFFGAGRVPSDGIPYPLFSFAALLPWKLLRQRLTKSGNSLVGTPT